MSCAMLVVGMPMARSCGFTRRYGDRGETAISEWAARAQTHGFPVLPVISRLRVGGAVAALLIALALPAWWQFY